MSLRHEEHLVETLGGRMTRGSGNQWRDQTDGKHDDDEFYQFAWDGKATLAASTSVSLSIWRKLVEQAEHRLPMLPLRFYADERLTRVHEDLVVVRLEDLADILADANAYRAQEGRA